MNQKGGVLVQVLVLGALMLFLATLLIKAATHLYTYGSLAVGRTSAVKSSETALATAQNAWNLPPNNGSICSSYTWPSGDSVTCSGTPGTCGCTCSVIVGGTTQPTVSAATSGGNCQVSVLSASYP